MPPPHPSRGAERAPTQTQTVVSKLKPGRLTEEVDWFFHHLHCFITWITRGLLLLPWRELNALLSESHSLMQRVHEAGECSG